MAINLNNAPEQRSGDLIPHGTILPVHLTLRAGNAGDGGWLKRSKDGGSMSLDCEFTVTEGPHAKRKFWSLMLVEGTTDGHAKAAEISFGRIRAIIESVYGISPSDQSDAAKQKRMLQSFGDLDGLRFVAKVGIEKGATNPQTGEVYKDKNTLVEVITPDKNQWVKLDQVPREARQPQGTPAAHQIPAAAAGGASKPSWA